MKITSLGQLSEELEGVLTALLRGYQELRGLAGEHREAIRRADTGAIGRAVARQTAVLQALADAEERRRALIAGATGVVTLPRTGRATTLSDVAAFVPEPARGRLLALAAELKEHMRAVQMQGTSLRAAATGLVAHMEGLMRQVGKQLSHAGTYSPRGVVDARVAVVSALDLRH
jgi:hypothetical protein